MFQGEGIFVQGGCLYDLLLSCTTGNYGVLGRVVVCFSGWVRLFFES